MSLGEDPTTGLVIVTILVAIVLTPVFGPWIWLGVGGGLLLAKRYRDHIGL